MDWWSDGPGRTLTFGIKTENQGIEGLVKADGDVS